jgi:predicted nucleotidyltransferase/uncharacterized protein (UPF0332 family)
MEFKVEKRKPVQPKDYSKDDIDIAYRFAHAMYKEFERFIRAVVLFGSVTKKEGSHDDIDMLVIVDDVSYQMTPELVEAYRVITESHVAKISTRLHITTLKFTSFWDLVRVGDPVAVNILRDGLAVIDTGFYYPLQMLLMDGKIRPSNEAVQAYLARGTTTLANSEWHILQAALDLYWACIDTCHSALMKIGVLPPSPKEIASVLQEKLVKPGHVPKKCFKIMDNAYSISKRILHRELKSMKGSEYDVLFRESKEFVEEMKKFIARAK